MRMLQRFYTDFQRLAVLVAAAVLLWMQARAVLMFVQHDWIAVNFPYPLDYGEGPLLDQIVRLAHFENIYRVDLTVPPYTVANYPPLFLLAQLPCQRCRAGPVAPQKRAIAYGARYPKKALDIFSPLPQ
jgi:hypothetical protein